jgi:hypothetical protein
MNDTISGLPRLSGDYNRGYSKAIQDIIEVFDYMNDDLKARNMRMNYNWAEKILRCCLENREKMRDDRNGFIRTEKSEGGKRDVVKWYEPPR